MAIKNCTSPAKDGVVGVDDGLGDGRVLVHGAVCVCVYVKMQKGVKGEDKRYKEKRN